MTVESRHEGRTHTNAISLDVLLKMLRATKHAKSDAEMLSILEQAGIASVESLLIEVHDNGHEQKETPSY